MSAPTYEEMVMELPEEQRQHYYLRFPLEGKVGVSTELFAELDDSLGWREIIGWKVQFRRWSPTTGLSRIVADDFFDDFATAMRRYMVTVRRCLREFPP